MDVFYPSNKHIGRLVRRSRGSDSASIEVKRVLQDKQEIALKMSLTNHTIKSENVRITGSTALWNANVIESVYIPVKDMMANAPAFRSLYAMRNIHFEEIYADIIDRAFLPALRGPIDTGRKQLLSILQRSIDGKVITKNEEFFLKNKQGELEFTLLAEGYRKLGLLWLLIQNGTLFNGSALFWDEPEANLNPVLLRTVVEILIKLQRLGVQIFIATHDYILLKEFDLAIEEHDNIKYHSLYRDKKTNEIRHTEADCFTDILRRVLL
jgi:hypothetical protein